SADSAGSGAPEIQPVAHAVDGADQILARAHGSQLAAQVLHVTVHGPIGDDAAVVVQAIQYLVAGKDAPGLAGQQRQQPEFHRCQIQRRAVQAGAPGAFVDVQPTGAARRCRHGRAAAQNRLDAGHDLARAVGLADVIVGTQFQAQQAVDLFGPGSDHDDRDGSPGADVSAQVQAVAPGQHQVQQHQV